MIAFIIIVVILLVVRSFVIGLDMSMYRLPEPIFNLRLAVENDKQASESRLVYTNRKGILVIRLALSNTLALTAFLVLLMHFNMVYSLVIFMISVVLSNYVSSFSSISSLSEKVFYKHIGLIAAVSKPLGRLSGLLRIGETDYITNIGSYEELVALLDDKKFNKIDSAVSSAIKNVVEVTNFNALDLMVEKSRLPTLHANDTLSPSLLDELEKCGLGFFPVVESDAKKVEGVIWISTISNLSSSKHHLKVSDIMMSDFHAVDSDTSISELSRLISETSQPVFIVVSKGVWLGAIYVSEITGSLLSSN